jgi:hypothetical protein
VTPTKFDAIALIAKSDETDDWPGIKLVLEAGKASLQGKLVDSVTIRVPRKPPSPRGQAAQPSPKEPPPVVEAEAELDDDIGF